MHLTSDVRIGPRKGAIVPTTSLALRDSPDAISPRRGIAGPFHRLRDRVAAFYDLDDRSAATRGRLPALDGIRGFAALQIIVYHCLIVSAAYRINGFKTLGAGLFGVDIFFVLSGFVLFLPWAEARMRGAPPPALGRYFARRFRRIAPAYYFMLFFLIVFFTPAHIAPSLVYSWSGLVAVLTHLTFQQAVVMRGLGDWIGWHAQPGFGVNGVIWTLTFEVYFYLLLPFVSRFFCGSVWKVIRNAGIAVLVTIAWAWVRFNVDGIADRLFGISLVSHKNTLARDRIQNLMANLLPTYAAHFAFGMAAAYLFLRLRDRPALTHHRAFRVGVYLAQLLGAAAFIALMHWTGGLRARDGTVAAPAYWYVGRVAVAGSAALLILATVLAGQIGQFPFSNLPMRIMGQVSYGMYLWHALVITLVLDYPIIGHWHSVSKFKFLLLLVLPITFILGTFSYKFVEAPFMRPRINPAAISPPTAARAAGPALPEAGTS